MPGVERAIAAGYADPDRIGVMGRSYGGYSALVLIAQSSRFGAAVPHAPVSNLVDEYLQMGVSGESKGVQAAEEGSGAIAWFERYLS